MRPNSGLKSEAILHSKLSSAEVGYGRGSVPLAESDYYICTFRCSALDGRQRGQE